MSRFAAIPVTSMLPTQKQPAKSAEWFALAGGLILLVWFQLDTWPVRFANVDDLETFHVTQNGQIVNYISAMSKSQSRFYQLWNLGLVELLNQIESPFWFGLHRMVLVGTQFALGGWLLARLSGAACCGWLFWIIGLGTLQIAPGFYPVLSYPPISFGFVALLTAALAYDEALTEGRRHLLAGSAVCFLASMLFHETFAIYAVLFPLILVARRRKQFRASLSTLIPPGIALGLYVTVYLAYRWVTFVEHTYDGTTPSFAFLPTLTAWFRYTFSVMPSFELWVDRANDQLGTPLFRNFDSAMEMVRNGLSLSVVIKTALVTVSAGLLLHRPRQTMTGRATLRLAAATCLLALLTCVPIALSQKYQIWALQRKIPYVYSFFAAFFAWGTMSALLIFVAGTRPGLRRSISKMLALVLIAYSVLCAQITNPRILDSLMNTYNRPVTAAVSPLER